jgi:hypothetical protein
MTSATKTPSINAAISSEGGGKRRGMCEPYAMASGLQAGAICAAIPLFCRQRRHPVVRAAISDPKRHTAYEPLYDIDPQTGASVEIFYADGAVARSFGTSETGWFWWTCQSGSLPHNLPTGPFTSSYRAYRNFALAKG